MLDKFLHKILRRPYRLKVRLKIGKGKPLILLHGINSDSSVWSDLASYFPVTKYQFIAIDLLGFGKSPKPRWKKYNIRDHADAIIATLQAQNFKPPYTIVGHSMGSLITVELMKRYPDLIDHAILVALPLYPSEEDLADTPFGEPDKKLRELYFRIYRKFAGDKDGTLGIIKRLSGLMQKYSSFELNDENYRSFTKSLENTINNQNTFGELRNTSIKTDIVYGRFDPLVVSKYIKYLSKHNPKIASYVLNASHDVTTAVTKKVAELL